MLRWLFRRKPRRDLFHFTDGEGTKRTADPLACWRGMMNHAEYRHDVHPKQVDEGDQEALEITLRMIQDVFGVEEWAEDTPEGLTQGEMLDLLISFIEYTSDVKKNTSLSATPPPPTESTSPESNEPTPSDSSPSTSSKPAPTSETPM
jgi:hypothetical protein